jgi:uncharacterized protein YprB with RNaseH-like and TPR domain
LPLAERVARQRGGRRTASDGISDQALSAALGGIMVDDGLIAIDTVVALPARHGRFDLVRPDDLILPYLRCAITPRPEDLLFVDTETSGLAGGSGTLAFLVGLARFEGAALRIRQLFLTGFRGEAALLNAVAEWVQLHTTLVSFNGKTFDLPLLATRYRLARKDDPFAALAHVDLLHPTRNAFARCWQDCRLQTAEALLLGLAREDDLPGHLIPYAWFNFVRSRQAGEIPRILDHNYWDVRSLAALLLALADVYTDPLPAGADARGVARAYRRNGGDDEALRVLSSGCEGLDEKGLLELAALHRRRRQWPEAIALWRRLEANGCLVAMENLAKYFEHACQDPQAALSYAEKLLENSPHSVSYRVRRDRLRRKLEQARD